MEIKEYLNLLKAQKRLFWEIVGGIILVSFAYFYLKPVVYETSLILNVTRKGSQASQDYRFDDFYRLQADEKFSETLVQWLKSPRVISDIWSHAGKDLRNPSLRQISGMIKAEKLSPQVISVKFSASEPETAKKISASILEIISEKTESLNKDQQEETWFQIQAFDPIIVLAQINPLKLLFFSFLVGIFLGFWTVLIRHYLK